MRGAIGCCLPSSDVFAGWTSSSRGHLPVYVCFIAAHGFLIVIILVLAASGQCRLCSADCSIYTYKYLHTLQLIHNHSDHAYSPSVLIVPHGVPVPGQSLQRYE